MQQLFEYLILSQIEEDLKFLNDDTVDEGKIKDGIQKVWGWIKGKFNKKKKENSDKTKKDKEIEKIKDKDLTKSIEYNIYDYNQINEKIRKNNQLTKGIKIIDKGYDNKYKIVVAETKNDILGCLFYITHDKYDYPEEFRQYNDYDHIFSMQIDQDNFNQGIGKGLINKVISNLKKNSNYKGLTLDIREYNTKTKLYSKYFEVKKIEDAEIAIYNK